MAYRGAKAGGEVLIKVGSGLTWDEVPREFKCPKQLFQNGMGATGNYLGQTDTETVLVKWHVVAQAGARQTQIPTHL